MAPRACCCGSRRACPVTAGHAPRTPTLRRHFVAAKRGRLTIRRCPDVRRATISGPTMSPLVGPRLNQPSTLEN